MKNYFVGLISGTSMDGIDAALLAFEENRFELIAGHTFEYSTDLKKRLGQAVSQAKTLTVPQMGELDHELGLAFAEAALAVVAQSQIAMNQVVAIGSHGQTLFHAPDSSYPFTLQAADPNIIAAKTGATVVADFRRKDMAFGGEGAPLAPGFHDQHLRSADENRIVLNIGGIANITVLSSNPVLGYDTGPGNTLMDAWTKHCLQQPFDKDGAWAKQGTHNPDLLDVLLKDPYFQKPAPKSTGPEYFNLDWLWDRLGPNTEKPVDIQALLLQLTAQSIAEAIGGLDETFTGVYVCGGGSQNHELMAALGQSLHPITVSTTLDLGIHPDWVEAATFAWLARQTLQGQTGNLPSVTGASKATTLGVVVHP